MNTKNKCLLGTIAICLVQPVYQAFADGGLFMGLIFLAMPVGLFAFCFMVAAWEDADNERISTRSKDRQDIQARAFDRYAKGEIDEDQFNREYDKSRTKP